MRKRWPFHKSNTLDGAELVPRVNILHFLYRQNKHLRHFLTSLVKDGCMAHSPESQAMALLPRHKKSVPLLSRFLLKNVSLRSDEASVILDRLRSAPQSHLTFCAAREAPPVAIKRNGLLQSEFAERCTHSCHREILNMPLIAHRNKWNLY